MEQIEDDMDEEEFGLEDELDLVAVDAEVIKGMIRTQGQILGHLERLYSSILLLSSEYNELREWLGEMADANKELANAFRLFVKTMKERKCLANSVMPKKIKTARIKTSTRSSSS